VLRRQVDTALDGCDALLLPALPIVAPPLGDSEIAIDPSCDVRVPVRSAMLKHTQLFNLTGHPAISLPVASPGLPVGLQLVGRLNDTPALLAVAAACERILGG
jgi:Asp-tRNA(Asn)/Glu-tRNA(Gln) amidotransferase A subunit family amidase